MDSLIALFVGMVCIFFGLGEQERGNRFIGGVLFGLGLDCALYFGTTIQS